MVIQMAKSLLSSNKVISSLKDEGLYNKATHFRHVNAEQSQLNTIDKAFRNHETSQAFNEHMAERAKDLSEGITNAKSVKKQERLQAQLDAVTANTGLSEEAFAQKRAAAIADGGKTRNKEYADALKQPAKDLKKGVLNYYNTGDGWKNTARVGATVGAYGVAAVGTRYMSGGSATTNNRGQRDIAGIPFI